jgi:hypothetical protein
VHGEPSRGGGKQSWDLGNTIWEIQDAPSVDDFVAPVLHEVGVFRVPVHHHSVHFAFQLVLLVVIQGDVVLRQTRFPSAVLEEEETNHDGWAGG